MSDEPRLRIEPLAVDRWQVTNEGATPLRLLETWLPHERFRGETRRHDLDISPGGSATLDLPVATSGAAGEVLENAFLILRFEDWRVLARLTIRFDDERRPHPAVAVVTSQRAGFSGVKER